MLVSCFSFLVTSEDMSHWLLSSNKHQSNPEVAMQSISQCSMHFAPWCQHYTLCSTSQGNWTLLWTSLPRTARSWVLNWRWQGQQHWGDVRKYLCSFGRKQFEKDKSLAKSGIGKEDYENSRNWPWHEVRDEKSEITIHHQNFKKE